MHHVFLRLAVRDRLERRLTRGSRLSIPTPRTLASFRTRQHHEDLKKKTTAQKENWMNVEEDTRPGTQGEKQAITRLPCICFLMKKCHQDRHEVPTFTDGWLINIASHSYWFLKATFSEKQFLLQIFDTNKPRAQKNFEVNISEKKNCQNERRERKTNNVKSFKRSWSNIRKHSLITNYR